MDLGMRLIMMKQHRPALEGQNATAVASKTSAQEFRQS